MQVENKNVKVVKRKKNNNEGALLRLDSGEEINVRRYFPAGVGDLLNITPKNILAYVSKDDEWLSIGKPWRYRTSVNMFDQSIDLIFGEIETKEDLAQYKELRAFHYRGGGGAGRSVPIIGKSTIWDLPSVLGFVEITSSMIANSARKQFFDAPFESELGVLWLKWDRRAGKNFSNTICRISRFVIHPEIRGLSLATAFLDAATRYARDRWFFGGRRPYFMEITADMLRFYPFVNGSDFTLMGLTEGNEHRLSKDMKYLVQKALSEGGEKSMPQGGGGIMSLQRGYARQIVSYMEKSNKKLADVIDSLRFDPARLDQDSWEALYKINRRPKPSYICGLRPAAKRYVSKRYAAVFRNNGRNSTNGETNEISWKVSQLDIEARANIQQTTEGRLLQDTFGFVGRDIRIDLIKNFEFELYPGEITMVCGASGAGKTLFLQAVQQLAGNTTNTDDDCLAYDASTEVRVRGIFKGTARASFFQQTLDETLTPLELKGDASLSDFIEITAISGLAEPQLLVRPIKSLSSGQKYRLSVALVFLKNPEIVIIDNFCESLDRYTMLAVCRGISNLSRSRGSAVLLASAAYERVEGIVDWSQRILLRRGHAPQLVRRSDAK